MFHLYTPKKHLWFSDFFRGYRSETLLENSLTCLGYTEKPNLYQQIVYMQVYNLPNAAIKLLKNKS